MSYLPRVIDATLAKMLNVAGAVLIEGVRACGKTATGMQHSGSSVRLDTDDPARELAGISPELLLDGRTPRFIDEWQLAPRLWNHVRSAVDDRQAPGQFILAGSATPADDITRHSGAGRILRIRMRTMSFVESKHSNAQVSLSKLLDGDDVTPTHSELDVPGLVDLICRGGWPGLQNLEPADAQQLLRSYLEDVARSDILAAEQVKRDPTRVRRVMSAYGRHVATPASISSIAADSVEPGSPAVHVETISEYLVALERVMVIEEQPSWGPHLRSRDVVRKGSLRHFVDPSLAVAAMNASPKRLLRDLNALGLLFESLVVRDLRVYSQALDGEVRHYRDSAGAEADAIVQLRDGRWAAVEVKLGEYQVDAAAASLTNLIRKIDTGAAGEPAARIIITGGRYAYTRPDGIHVVPLACLAP